MVDSSCKPDVEYVIVPIAKQFPTEALIQPLKPQIHFSAKTRQIQKASMTRYGTVYNSTQPNPTQYRWLHWHVLQLIGG